MNSKARRAAEHHAALQAEIAQPLPAHIDALEGILQLAKTGNLVGLLRSGLDVRMMLGWQLCNRGLDQNGAWVGFAEAERLFVAAFPGAIDAGLLP